MSDVIAISWLSPRAVASFPAVHRDDCFEDLIAHGSIVLPCLLCRRARLAERQGDNSSRDADQQHRGDGQRSPERAAAHRLGSDVFGRCRQ